MAAHWKITVPRLKCSLSYASSFSHFPDISRSVRYPPARERGHCNEGKVIWLIRRLTIESNCIENRKFTALFAILLLCAFEHEYLVLILRLKANHQLNEYSATRAACSALAVVYLIFICVRSVLAIHTLLALSHTADQRTYGRVCSLKIPFSIQRRTPRWRI